MLARPEQVDLVVAAMLSVSAFPLEKAQQIVPKLRSARLLDPDHACNLDAAVYASAVSSAGYDRGALTPMYAARLRGLMDALRKGSLDQLATAVSARDEVACLKLLQTIKGIGPMVAKTAWILLTHFDGRPTRGDES